MDDYRFDPLREQPPERKSRAWLWIGVVLGCLLCALLITISVPVGAGVAFVARLTDEANATASRPRPTPTRAPGRRSTPTKVPLPTRQATSTLVTEDLLAEPPAGWEMVIDDSFDSNQHGWDTEFYNGQRTTRRPAVAYGRYIYPFERLTLAELDIERPADLREVEADRFFLAVDARQLGGTDTKDTFGLAFRHLDHETYILFQVNNQGEACVLTFGGEEDQALAPCSPVQSIKAGEFTRLAVATIGDSYVFFVNGEVIGRIGDLPLRKGRVAVFVSAASDQVTFEFDNFQLYVPPK